MSLIELRCVTGSYLRQKRLTSFNHADDLWIRDICGGRYWPYRSTLIRQVGASEWILAELSVTYHEI